MGLFNRKKNRIDEATKAFKNKIVPNKENSGEGIQFLDISGNSLVDSLGSFNLFNDGYINKKYVNEVAKIKGYRNIAQAVEVSDVIEDAIIESTQENSDGSILKLKFTDDEIEKNENKVNTLKEEFDSLFVNKLKMQTTLWNILYNYYVDGRVYIERIGKAKNGITGIKILPSETMDFKIGPDGRIEFFVQYLNKKSKMPNTIEEGEKDKDIIVFYPSQISYINTGHFGPGGPKDIYGYLEKCKQPFNQLKLLETAVIIYRIIRAPERLVFRIDTGNMPKEKALKYVEKIKTKFQQKETYDPETGRIINKPAITSLLENYFIPQSADGRGSQIETIGGNFAGFSELDDIYYFQKKLYRALKYPMSRITKSQENQDGDNVLFAGGRVGEITRDEIKWAKFLERHQNRICYDLKEIFLLHLEFKGIKEEYELNRSSFNIIMTPPNFYKDQIEQLMLETRQNNYQNFANNQEFPKTWLMRKYLELDDDDFEQMKEDFKKDKEIFPQDEGF